MAEKNVKLVIEYDGTAYHGWQKQSEDRTIQGELAKAIQKITRREVKIQGAGRTDAGVHALGQVANFRIEHRMEAERFKPALNGSLDNDVRVHEAAEVPMDFHARFDAKWKRYRYLIGLKPSSVYRHQRWYFQQSIDLNKLKRAAESILGEHDFSAFCVTASLKEDNKCRIDTAKWRQVGNLLVFEIRGNRFLHHMVRSLVGGMLNLAVREPDENSRNLTIESFRDIIHAPENERNVFTAPAHGLYLVSVGY